MEREFIARGLQYHVLPSSHPTSETIQALDNDVYRFWHSQWFETFNELKGIPKLYADDYLRQKDRTFITYRGQIISFFAHCYFDLKLQSHREHSYFKSYPPQLFTHLLDKNLHRVMTMGYLCVAHDWRKALQGTIIAQLQAGMAYKTFEHSDADTLITFTRNDRKVNDLAYLYGSRCLIPKWKEHNVEVDVVYTLKEDLKKNPDSFLEATRMKLWNQRIIHMDAVAVTDESARKAA